jgi:hypothetical protein
MKACKVSRKLFVLLSLSALSIFFSSNAFDVIAEEITSIDLSNKEIKNLDEENVFVNYTRVKTIHLFSNKLSFIGKNLFRTNVDLEEINISFNKIKWQITSDL